MNKLLMLVMNFGSIFAHMALTEPAPRRSPQHPGYRGGSIDYDMTSPLGGGGRSFPCRGAPKGPNFKSYAAGSNIKVQIAGSAKHMGGHCQFSLTYDEVNFVVLKTVLGNCIIDAVDYSVLIPQDAPAGNVTFAWTWFNKIGNREIYMNCVDIEIESKVKTGSIIGPKMVVANLPGYPTFEEGFANDYKKDLYDSQPILSIAPKNSSPSPSTTPKPPTAPRSSTTPRPSTATIPSTTLRPSTTPRPSTHQEPITASPSTNSNHPKPTPTSCIEDTWVCKDQHTIARCFAKNLVLQPCSPGTQCRTFGTMARCS